LHIDLNRIEENPLWQILVDTVHSLAIYKPHKEYISELLKENPKVDAETLSVKLRISLGETIVILKELEKELKKDLNID
jgi:hypothetical protein